VDEASRRAWLTVAEAEASDDERREPRIWKNSPGRRSYTPAPGSLEKMLARGATIDKWRAAPVEIGPARPLDGQQKEDIVKYALLLYFDPDRPAEQRSATNPQIMADWIAYTRAIKQSGALLDVQQLHEVDTATAVRRRDGELMLTDGPFAETKEHLLGFYLIDVPDLDTALDWAGKMPNVGRGTVEVRPVMEGMAWQAVLNE
jgi:hypothetical protein